MPFSLDFAVLYGQSIRDYIYDATGGTDRTVKFFDQTGVNSFADGDTTYNGVCEVCHTLTTYHRNNAWGDDTHYVANNCISCHRHTDGFAHGGGEGAGCEDCHGKDADNGGAGTTQSHSTHMENDADDLKGPHITCGDCHDTDNYPKFKDGKDLFKPLSVTIAIVKAVYNGVNR